MELIEKQARFAAALLALCFVLIFGFHNVAFLVNMGIYADQMPLESWLRTENATKPKKE